VLLAELRDGGIREPTEEPLPCSAAIARPGRAMDHTWLFPRNDGNWDGNPLP